MTGSLINLVTILVGASLGLLIKSRLSDSMKRTLVVIVSLFTIGLGVKMFLDTQNVLVVLLSLLLETALKAALRGVRHGGEPHAH